MSWSLAAPAMLWGLLGMSIPVIIHLLNRKRAVTIDWGAMQFLDLGRRAHRKFQLTEMLLMLGRMLLMGLVAMAVTRPFWEPKSAGGAMTGALAHEPRDYVLVLDGSDSMERSAGGSTPRKQAIAWARSFVAGLGPEDGVAILIAKDRVRPLFDGFSHDRVKIDAAIQSAPASRGSSDLPLAVAESLRLLESGENSASELILLTDGQRLPWRAGEPSRWALLRDLHQGLKGRAPRIWSMAFGGDAKPEGADASVAPLELPRGVYPPNGSIVVSTFVSNAGPTAATRSAELLVDGAAVAGSMQSIGPIPVGGKVPLTFRTAIAHAGSHLLTVRLSGGDDPLSLNDAAERPVEVAAALPVLLVDGEPGVEPLSGETDFLRAALAPAEDEAPSIRARVIKSADFTADSLAGPRVVVLANVEKFDTSLFNALGDFLGRGGGLLIAPGDRIDADFYNFSLFSQGSGLLPAEIGATKGEFARRKVEAHPSPRSFLGPAMGAFGQGDSPPLGLASLFSYRVLMPAKDAAVAARLDTGDPWMVERPHRNGRVILMAAPLDAEGGTLPVNPDFVPLVHELIFRLADPAADSRPLKPGDSIRIDLAQVPGPQFDHAAVKLPDGGSARAPIVRAGGKARVQFDATDEPGTYQITLPPPAEGPSYYTVVGDAREADAEPLAASESARLAEGWPMTFEAAPDRLPGRLIASGSGGPRPLWRGFVLLALGGLCVEVWMTRKLVKARGMAAVEEDA